MGRSQGHFCTVLWMRDLLKEIWELGADVRGGGVRKGVAGYPCTPLLTLDTLSFSYLILDIPLIMLWGKTQLYRKECSRTPVDRLFDGMLLPFTIVVKFVVAGKRNQTSETNAEWEKNLWCSIDPNLKYNKNSVYVKKGNMTVLLCKVCNHVTRPAMLVLTRVIRHATYSCVFVENGEKNLHFKKYRICVDGT